MDDSEDEPVHVTVDLAISSTLWWIALVVAILALLVYNPGTYNMMNLMATSIGFPTILRSPGNPNIWGLLIATIVYFLVIRILI